MRRRSSRSGSPSATRRRPSSLRADCYRTSPPGWLSRTCSWATDFSTSLEVDIAVLSPVAAKGLEFDAVVVIEPAAMIQEEPGAERALFVALTRAVQHLSILHVVDLPSALR